MSHPLRELVDMVQAIAVDLESVEIEARNEAKKADALFFGEVDASTDYGIDCENLLAALDDAVSDIGKVTDCLVDALKAARESVEKHEAEAAA